MATSNDLCLSGISSLSDLVRFLKSELQWPLIDDEIDEISFEYDPLKDLQLDLSDAELIQHIYQLRPLSVEQTFGIFFVEFGARYMPMAILKRILTSLVSGRWKHKTQQDYKSWKLEDLLFVSASEGDHGRRLDLAYFDKSKKAGRFELRMLGWDTNESREKLAWVEEALRDVMQWPDNGEFNRWRKTWKKGFSSRPHRIVGAWADLDASQRKILVELYSATEITVDALPYTRDFDWLHQEFNSRSGADLSCHQFWRAISSARKTGQLVRKAR